MKALDANDYGSFPSQACLGHFGTENLQPLVRDFKPAIQAFDFLQPLVAVFHCSPKGFVVENALRTASRPIGVASYAIVPQLPEDYRNELPSPKAIAERLQAWEDGR